MPTLRPDAILECTCLGGDTVAVTLDPSTVYENGSLAKIELHKIVAYDLETDSLATEYLATCYGSASSGHEGSDAGGTTGGRNMACYEVPIGPSDPNDEGRMTRVQAYMPRVAPGYYMAKVWTKRPSGAWSDSDGGGLITTPVLALPPLRHQEVYDLRLLFPPPWSPGVLRADVETMIEA